MLCQKCHKRTASIFISSIINGQETKTYLCNDCAKDYPLFNLSLDLDEPFSIKDLMENFNIEEIKPKGDINKHISLKEDTLDDDIVCSNCHSTYNEYRQTGKLGCSNCYKDFYIKLKSILKNIYGYSEYIGKIPKSDNNHIYISKEIKILKEDLNRAVEKEEYEKAADIRDKIRELEGCNE